MKHKVLYRKYRPSLFSEIIGQDCIINILRKSIVNDRIGHSYLFCGPRGTGKTSAARVFAHAVNCLNLVDGEPCGKCCNCLDTGSSDIIEIDAASNNGVDEIRELRNNVKVMPSTLKYKIYIIDEVHMLSSGAFNALLKTLEEPPQHVIFILATTDPQKVPLTVLSRCQRFDFKKIPASILANHLKYIANIEKINITDDALTEIAFLGDGAVRDSLSYLEQISSAYDKIIDIDDIENAYKTVSTKVIEDLINIILNGTYQQLNKTICNLENNEIDFSTFVNKFIVSLRKFSLDTNDLDIRKKLKQLIFELNDLLIKSISGVNPYLLLEIVLSDYIRVPSKSESVEDTTLNKEKTIEEKEELTKENNNDRIAQFTSNQLIKEYINKLIDVRTHNCFVNANKDMLEYNRKLWKEFVEKVQENKKIFGHVVDTNVVLGSDNYLIIEVKNNSQAGLFNDNLSSIEEEFNKIINVNIKIIALTTNDWNVKKKIFIEDKKNKIEYQIEEEPKPVIIAENKKQEVIFEIFDAGKIEIE